MLNRLVMVLSVGFVWDSSVVIGVQDNGGEEPPAKHRKLSPSEKITAIDTIKNTKELNFSTARLSRSGCDVVFSFLPLFSNLESLNLSKCHLNPVTFSNVLPQISHLEVLYLNKTQLGDTGLQVLSPVLGQMPKLLFLDLEYNGIGEIGIQAFSKSLAQSNLEVLGLSGNNLNDAVAYRLSVSMPPSMLELYVINNSFSLRGKNALLLAEKLANYFRENDFLDVILKKDDSEEF